MMPNRSKVWERVVPSDDKIGYKIQEIGYRKVADVLWLGLMISEEIVQL